MATMFLRHTVPPLAALTLMACASYSLGDPLSPATETLVEGDVTLAVPLADGSLLVDDGTQLSIVYADAREPTPVGTAGEIGTLRAYVALGTSTLVAGSEGTFVVQTTPRSGLFRAPIEDVIGDEVIRELAATPRPDAPSDLWVATEERLYLFRDETLTEVRVEGASLASVSLATRGSLSVWAATPSRLLQVRVESATRALSATEVARPPGASALAVDANSTLWLVSGGALWSLGSDLRLDAYDLPFAPDALFAARDASDVWVRAEDGSFYHQLDRIFRRVESAPLDDVRPGPNGTLFAHVDGATRRVRARHPITVEGLHSGPILSATRVEVLMPNAEHVVEVRAHAGAVILEVAPPFDVASTPPAFTLEPGPVPVGTHRLIVEADYDDGTLTAVFEASIDIATDATWTNDIEPIYQNYCADCHGERGPSPTRLDERAQWIERSDRIIENVVTGRMPLSRPMLPPSDIALIQAWASGGFAE
jgi:hypothetical protein